jgi:hypothetical protein
MRAWNGLVREIRGADGRVVVSSEWFCDATVPDIRRIVEDIDRSRCHVVVTLRPLASILTSQWQQFVQGGITIPYETWLRTIFDEPGSGTGRRFWHRHRHDQLIERWAAVAGAARVTAVVVDDQDHAAVLRIFERLVGLREGTLQLVPDRSNRSLTRPEAELVRAVNGELAAVGVEGPSRLDLVLFGAAANLKLREPDADEPRISTPSWALARAAEVASQMVEGIRGSGVRIVGDPDRLLGASHARPARADASPGSAERAWPDIAASGALGVLVAAGLARSGREIRAVEPFSTQRIRSILLGRLRDAVTAS